MSFPQDQPYIQLFTEIGIIDQLARNRLERSLPDGLKMSQFTVLHHLERLGGEWSPARLARAFQLTRGAMTNNLQKLEARGLVHIAADLKDGRAKIVTITQAGRHMRTRCLQQIEPFIAELSDEFSAADAATALPVLQKLRAYLDTHRS